MASQRVGSKFRGECLELDAQRIGDAALKQNVAMAAMLHVSVAAKPRWSASTKQQEGESRRVGGAAISREFGATRIRQTEFVVRKRAHA